MEKETSNHTRFNIARSKSNFYIKITAFEIFDLSTEDASIVNRVYFFILTYVCYNTIVNP